MLRSRKKHFLSCSHNRCCHLGFSDWFCSLARFLNCKSDWDLGLLVSRSLFILPCNMAFPQRPAIFEIQCSVLKVHDLFCTSLDLYFSFVPALIYPENDLHLLNEKHCEDRAFSHLIFFLPFFLINFIVWALSGFSLSPLAEQLVNNIHIP